MSDETKTPDAPAMPYDVRDYPYGVDGRMMPTKVYAGHGGDLLTPEELQVWACVQELRQRNAALADENARLKADLDAATAPTESKRRGK